MPKANIIKDPFGQHYAVKTPTDPIVQDSFQAKSFWNPGLTQSFSKKTRRSTRLLAECITEIQRIAATALT